jgi:S1-C subfamily serine protease
MSDVIAVQTPGEFHTIQRSDPPTISALELLQDEIHSSRPMSPKETPCPSIPEVIDKIGTSLGRVYRQHPYLSTAAMLALPPLLNARTRAVITEGAEFLSGRIAFAGEEALATVTQAPYKLRVYEWNTPAVLTGVARDSKTGEILSSARDAVARVTGVSTNFEESNVESLATAFSVSKDGRFLTNYHVIKNFPTCKLVDKYGLEHKATVLMRDEKNDLAVLQLDSKLSYSSFKPLKLADGLAPGYSNEKNLLAFGHSNGCRNLHMSKSAKVSVDWPGLEKSKEHGFSVVPLTIRPGNSGSPIIDQETGEVVGVARAVPTEKEFNFQLSVVVPSERARELLQKSRL